jgi:predicted ATP-grasp superfamily ATP-dependent carboligase
MYKTKGGRPFAVVIGGELNGLGVTRSLARESVPTVVVDTDASRPTMRTRFGRKHVVSRLSGQPFVDELLRLRTDFQEKPVLFLTQEASVFTVSAAYDVLSAAYHISMPLHSTMEMLLDKRLFQARAEALGFAIPRSITLEPGDDCRALEDLRYPCVLKSVIKNPASHLPKAHQLTDPVTARELWNRIGEAVGSAVVQEWIEGEDSDVHFCLQYRTSGAEAVSFAGRKTCQWPPLVGGTATCMPAPEAEAELAKTTNRFFDAVGFVGLGSMEYKRDRRDGRFYMVEPTVGRTDYQEEIATLNGVNLPYAAWLDGQGLPMPTAVRPVQPIAWRDPYGHHNAVQRGAVDALATLAPQMKVEDAYFRKGDPGPYLAARLDPVLKRLRRAVPASAAANGRTKTESA